MFRYPVRVPADCDLLLESDQTIREVLIAACAALHGVAYGARDIDEPSGTVVYEPGKIVSLKVSFDGDNGLRYLIPLLRINEDDTSYEDYTG